MEFTVHFFDPATTFRLRRGKRTTSREPPLQ